MRRYLGGPFDLDAFAAFAATEPVLAGLVPALRGFRPPLVPDPFETLVTSITAQQISLRAAFSIRNRLIEAFGERHEVAHAFPTRERLALARPEEIVAVGFSRRKAEYVVGLAQAELDLDALALLPDDEVKAALVALPGIGEWTADWFLARHLGRPGGLAGRRPRRSARPCSTSTARTRTSAPRCAFFALCQPGGALPARRP